jgi:UDP-N-acetyl-D-glucosamine dehydrogenase
MRTLNYKTRFIDLASEINSQMPAYVVEKVVLALNDERKALNGSRALVVGVAYKRDVEDVRESPALDIMRLLASHGAEVAYHDPHIPVVVEDGHEWRSVALTGSELEEADVVVIVTDHRAIDYQMLVDRASLIVDTRNATKNCLRTGARIVSLSSAANVARSAEPVGSGD